MNDDRILEFMAQVSDYMRLTDQRFEQLITVMHNGFERATAQISQLTDEVRATNQRVDVLTDEVRATNQRVDKLTDEVRATNQRVDKLTDEVRATNQRVDKLTDEVRATNQRVDVLTDEVRATNQRVDKLIDRVDVLTDRVDTLTNEVREVRIEAQVTNRRLGATFEQAGRLTEDATGQQMRLHQLEAEEPTNAELHRRVLALEEQMRRAS